MTFSTGKEISVDICQKLGLDPTNVRKVVITLEPNSLVTIWVERYMTKEEEGRLVDTLENHAFVVVER